MQSVYVSQIPLSLVAASYLGLLMLALGEGHRLVMPCVAAVFMSTTFILISIESRLAELGVIKFAVGSSLFFFTLFALPKLIERHRATFSKAITLALWVLSVTFFLDYFGIASFKALGLVRLWSADGVTEIAVTNDPRTSGLFSEPSWFCLATISLLTANWSLGGLSPIPVLATVLAIVLSQSSTGVVGLLLLFAGVAGPSWLGGSRTNKSTTIVRRFIWALFFVGSLAVVALALEQRESLDDFSNSANNVLSKIYDPGSSSSGSTRLFSPLPVIEKVSENSFIFGLGASAINQTLSGKIGTAILPFNVFIELGLYGLLAYSAALLWPIWRFRPTRVQLMLCTLNLFTLGLPSSPFQSAMLALMLFRTRGYTSTNSFATAPKLDKSERSYTLLSRN
ncbi:hypothetical protein [Bradyrhizobium elkanii]|uniref:hypothetical protein n=1 Tax=Bradyrhizobium elkanii TaxID=29448 RepID=UPI0012BCDB3A|nr:hypothetical protein [Bradyrhizobium elkanii]